VAANTLIGLETNGGLKPNGVTELEKQLKEVRAKHFGARSRRTKEKYRTEDKKIRSQIAELLKQGGINETSADLITDWNPYDQNASAKWFDAEWMFGIEKGFDIVIGNPPYVQMQKDGGHFAKMYVKENYETFERTGDIYSLFYERGFQVLKEKGFLTFITSNQWMRANYGKSLRKFFLKQNPLFLINLGPGVFQSAIVDTNILVGQKAKYQIQLKGFILNQNEDINLLFPDNFLPMKNLDGNAWTILEPIQKKIKETIEKKGTPLKDWNLKIYRGVLTGFNEAFLINEEKRNELVSEDKKSAKIMKPILRGKDIQRFLADKSKMFLINSHNGLKSKNIERININDFPAIKKH